MNIGGMPALEKLSFPPVILSRLKAMSRRPSRMPLIDLLQWLKKVSISSRAASEVKSPFMSVTMVPACMPCPVRIAEGHVQRIAFEVEVVVISADLGSRSHEDGDLR